MGPFCAGITYVLPLRQRADAFAPLGYAHGVHALPLLGELPGVVVGVLRVDLLVDGLRGACEGDVGSADMDGAGEGHVGDGVEIGDFAGLSDMIAVGGTCGGYAGKGCNGGDGLYLHFGLRVRKRNICGIERGVSVMILWIRVKRYRLSAVQKLLELLWHPEIRGRLAGEAGAQDIPAPRNHARSSRGSSGEGFLNPNHQSRVCTKSDMDRRMWSTFSDVFAANGSRMDFYGDKVSFLWRRKWNCEGFLRGVPENRIARETPDLVSRVGYAKVPPRYSAYPVRSCPGLAGHSTF